MIVDEGYSKRPLPETLDVARAGDTHHPECDFDGAHPDTCHCKALYERDYLDAEEQEAEELHNEYWT